MIVVDERGANASWLAANPDLFRDIFKFAVFVVQQVHTIAEANREISVAIIVEITRRAAQPAAL